MTTVATNGVQVARSPIYGLMSNPSMVDFPGRMAAVFFTTGCNFRCGFCHNASLLGAPREGYDWEKLDEICRRFRKQWIRNVVITGGEPTLCANLPETIDFFRERGFGVKLDTNGSNPALLAELLPKLDYVAMDVKCGLERYPSFVAFSHPEKVAAAIDLLVRGQTPYEFRTTLVEGIHDDDELRAIGEAVRGAALHVLQAFIPRENLPDPALRVTPRTTPSRLREAAAILSDYVREVRIRGD